MFSSFNLIKILQYNFCDPLTIIGIHYDPTHSTKIEDLSFLKTAYNQNPSGLGYCLYSNEEPLDEKNLNDFEEWVQWDKVKWSKPSGDSTAPDWNVLIQLFANSEHSDLKNQYLKRTKMYDWYFFYHGFVALDLFNVYKYIPKIRNPRFSHVFISYNHLIDQKRSYRMNLLAHLIDRDIDKFGLISMPLIYDHWDDEIFRNPNSYLSVYAKKLIYKTIDNYDKKLVIDTTEVHGGLSAELNLEFNLKALWHVVTETVFYDAKLHLTEKIFKPIVSRQPFILVAAPGNLAYLKSYGFKTFDRWVDESYDNEVDHDKRIQMITNELEKLSKLSQNDLSDMYAEMEDTVEYNFNHLFYSFKEIIVDELINNYLTCFKKYNCGKSSRFLIDYSNFDQESVKKLLLS